MRRFGERAFGQAEFDEDKNWYGHLTTGGWDTDSMRGEYNEHRAKALADPNYDLFAHFMPTDRPKYDIGRYVMRHNINVPIIRSLEEWQTQLMLGQAMARSEHPQDYMGFSGLYTSQVFEIDDEYPEDPSVPESERRLRYHPAYGNKRTVQGPPHRTIKLPAMNMLSELADHAPQETLQAVLRQGLHDGTVDPGAILRLAWWDRQSDRHNGFGTHWRTRWRLPSAADITTSRWRYIPGVNIRILRDPVIEGKYFIGGRESHHHWEITDGRDSDTLRAYHKAVYRGYIEPGEPEYELPTEKIVDLYEKIRMLPYFDQSQAPLMELQYGNDGKLYFLQYYKTGLTINDPGEFTLPTGQNIVLAHDVRGATSPEGERLRIYLDPEVFTNKMAGQGFWIEYHLSHGLNTQYASMLGRVTLLDYFLGLKDNHYDSAPLVRAPVAIGLYDRVGDALKQVSTLTRQAAYRAIKAEHRDGKRDRVAYINATVTSNGRQASIESDWRVRSESVN